MSALAEREPPIASQLTALRELLHQKFPAGDVREPGVLRTGYAPFDQCNGGLRQGVVTELVGPTSAGSLFIELISRTLVRDKAFGALVQAGDSFSPHDAEPAALRRLLWVRCRQPIIAVKAVDLLLRDGNLRLLILDLQFGSQRELMRIPSSTWHRFQRLAETTGMMFVILSSQPMIEGAKTRIAIRQRWSLIAMGQRRRDLLQQLLPQIFERRQFSELLENDQQSA
jgi:hypothetical protein